jgi:hypothetical protein
MFNFFINVFLQEHVSDQDGEKAPIHLKDSIFEMDLKIIYAFSI